MLIDLWYDKQNYGKVDRKGNYVFLSESNLSPIDDEGTFMAADFVVDAFHDLQQYFERAKVQGRINKDSVYDKIKPYRAWQNLNEIYHQNMSKIYEAFVVSYINTNNRSSKILNFRDFINEFILFSKDVLRHPITKTAFVKSNKCPVFVSGLVIDIAKETYTTKEKTLQKYINDSNYGFYLNAAEKFGFYINKHIPWQIIANVGSKSMLKYAEKYGIKYEPGTASDLFEIYYYKTQEFDIQILKKYLSQFYVSYIKSHPNQKKIESGMFETKSVITKRKNLTVSDVENIDWTEVYINIRSSEEGKNWNFAEIQEKIKTTKELENSLDTARSLSYVEQQLRSQVKTDISQDSNLWNVVASTGRHIEQSVSAQTFIEVEDDIVLPKLVWTDADTITISTWSGRTEYFYLSNGSRKQFSSGTFKLSVSGLGGLDTISEANSTWYYIYGVQDGNNIGLVGHTNDPDSGGPPSYSTAFKCFGAVRNDGSGDIIQFYNVSPGDFKYGSMFEVLASTGNGSDGAAVAVSLSTYVPAIATSADMWLWGQASGGVGWGDVYWWVDGFETGGASTIQTILSTGNASGTASESIGKFPITSNIRIYYRRVPGGGSIGTQAKCRGWSMSPQ